MLQQCRAQKKDNTKINAVENLAVSLLKESMVIVWTHGKETIIFLLLRHRRLKINNIDKVNR